MTKASDDSPHVAVFPPALFLGAMFLGIVFHWLWRTHLLTPGPARVVGSALVVVGLALTTWGRITMVRAGTNVKPSQPTTTIVTEGPFRFTRNPLYLGMTILYVGMALLINGLWPLLMLIPMLAILQWGVIAREERYLTAKFGESYLAYKRRVRQWL